MDAGRFQCGSCWYSPYARLLRYLAPVALTLIAIDIGEQALNRALASSFDAVDTLASFGISYVIIKLATGALSEIKMVSIMLLHNHSDRRRIGLCVLISGLCVVLFALIVAFTDFGFYLIDEVHRVPPNIGQLAKDTILYLSVFPLVDGIAWLHTGVLLRYKYSLTVGGASVLDNIVQVITVVALLQTSLSRTKPILIPVLATYFGTLARLLAVTIAYYKHVHHQLGEYTTVDSPSRVEERGNRLQFKKILSFWAPLALVQICQRISRPIVNLFVARDRLGGVTREEAVKALAVLSVCYPIGHLPYGWLNTLRSVEPAFTKRENEGERPVTVKHIRIFQLCCFLLSIALMAILFWIPGVASAILYHVSDVDKDIIQDAVVVLHVFSFFSIPVANRAVLTGNFVAKSQTNYLYPSIPARVIALIAMLFILPRVGVHRSLMGVAALISGFLAESLCNLIITAIVYYRSRSREPCQIQVEDKEIQKESEL
ncbi:progressive ankylosis protein homolog [Rhopilema esculentum]|uniref:progressive ankylosis protein homolog n=1 Tax=Rhopilema esculentum TaxID=499914 RepID=UPI0031E0D372